MTLILVTGAGGFLGRHVVPALQARGFRLRSLLRPGGAEPGWCAGTEVVRGDLLRPESLLAACREATTVVHLAARLNVPLETRRERELLREANLHGTARLLAAGRAAGVEEFLFLSSVAAMGDPPPGVVADEELSPSPDREYGRAKLAAEGLVGRARAEWGLRTLVLRPVICYGEGDRGNVGRMMAAVARGRFFLLGGGRARKSLVYAGNLAAAVAHLVPLRPPWEGETYIVTDEGTPSLAELAQAMARHLGARPPRSLPALPFLLLGGALEPPARLLGRRPLLSAHTVRKLTRDLLYSGARLRSETGFRPPFDLESALARTARWCQEEVLARPTG